MKIFNNIKMQIILAFLTITVFTGLIVSFISYTESKTFLENQLKKELEHSSSLIEKNIEDKLSEVVEVVLTISEKKDFKNLEKEKIQDIIEYFLEFADIFFNVYVYNDKGNLMAAAYYDKRPYKPYIGENFYEYKNIFAEYAGNVISDKKPRFTDTFYSAGDRLILCYISPIKDKEKVKGLISCAIYVQDKKLKSLLVKLKPSYNGFIYLMDQKGNNLAYAGNVPSRIEELKIEDLQKKTSAGEEFFELGNETYRYRLNKVDIANIYVLVAIPNSIAMNLLERYTGNMIIYTILSLILAIAISIFMANKLVTPISLLVKGLREVGKGNYSYRVKFKSTGEIERAIKAFNDMTEKLQKNRIIEKIWIKNWNK